MIRIKILFATVLSLFIFIFLSAFFITSVSAVKVDNDQIYLDVDPGMTYRVPISLSIPPDEPGDIFTLTVSGLSQSPFDGNYTVLDPGEDTSPYSARPFITLENSSVSLKSGENATSYAGVAVPADARDGGRYAMIIVCRASNLSAAEPVLTIPVFLDIRGGNDTETGVITGLEYTTYMEGGPARIVTGFQNTGNHYFSGMIGNVTVTDNKGSILAQETTAPFEPELIPGQEVRFEVSIANGILDTAYKMTARVERPDGSLLAEQEELLQDAAVTPRPTSSPGFGICAALLAIVIGILWSSSAEKR